MNRELRSSGIRGACYRLPTPAGAEPVTKDTEAWAREVLPAEIADRVSSAWKQMLSARAAKLKEFLDTMASLLDRDGLDAGEADALRHSFALSEGDNPVPWAHVIGSLMIQVIDEVYGRDVVIQVILKPHLLFRHYDEARRQLGRRELPPVPAVLHSALDRWLA